MKAVSLTTINPPRPAFLEPLLDMGFVVFVSGDSKTDHAAWRSLGKTPQIIYVDDNIKRFGLQKMESLVGEKTYARKNLSFLAAMAMGAQQIWELDDDNFATRDPTALLPHLDFHSLVASENKWENLFPLVHDVNHGWFRGFPLDEVGTESAQIERVFQTQRKVPSVVNFAVESEPDVDSIYRMTDSYYLAKRSAQRGEDLGFGLSTGFDRQATKCIHVTPDNYVPMNTQNTLWTNPDKFQWLYHPKSVSMRFSDIFKMHIATSRMDAGYGPATVVQLRNEHSAMEDFESEVSMWSLTKEVRLLASESAEMSLPETYLFLLEKKLVEETDVRASIEFANIVDKFI